MGELFEPHPLDGDTYPIEGHEIDLEQLVRDALLLELPLAPACDDADCAPATAPGVLVGAADSDPAGPEPTDPRWAALSELDLSTASRSNPMAVPKRKTPRAKTRQRRASNWRLAAPARSTCPNCGAVKQPHIVCGNCGWYGGRQVIDVE